MVVAVPSNQSAGQPVVSQTENTPQKTKINYRLYNVEALKYTEKLKRPCR